MKMKGSFQKFFSYFLCLFCDLKKVAANVNCACTSADLDRMICGGDRHDH